MSAVSRGGTVHDFPAHLFSLPASYLAFDRRGELMNRASSGVVLPSAMSVIKLGRNM